MPPERIVRAYEAKIDDVLPGERSVVAKINTNAIDRYRTVIEPMGIDLRGYTENPVVLWEHGQSAQRGGLPVGICRGIKARRAHNDVLAKTQFGKDEFSSALFEMYQNDTLRGFSVYVLAVDNPKRANSPPTAEEIKARPELTECEWMWRSTELAEYSAVGVPGNREALRLAVSRGLWIPDDRLPSLEGIARDSDEDDDEEMMSAAGAPLSENHECFETFCSCGRMVDHCCCAGGDKAKREMNSACTDCGGKMKPLEQKGKKRSVPVAPPVPAPIVELPPLTGRTFEQERARVIDSIRSAAKLAPASLIQEHARAAMDLQRGIV